MQKIALFLLFASRQIYPMHLEPIERISDEKTPLLIQKEEESAPQPSRVIANYQSSVSSYLDRLPHDVRYKTSLYLNPRSPAMQELLGKLSLNSEQAKEIYKKFFIYDSADLLLELAKNKETRKLIKQARDQQEKEIAALCRSTKTIIKEEDSAEKILLFMSQNAMPLETLEAITIETFPQAREQVVMSEAITTEVESHIQNREKFSRISSRVAALHSARWPCITNFICGPLLLVGLTVGSLCYTHWPIDGLAMMDCVENEYPKCYWDVNQTITNCSRTATNSTVLYDCCVNYANAYCNSWNYNISRAFPRENLKVWTPFMVVATVYIGIQLVAFILARTKNCCTVNPETKNVVQRYHDKIKELRTQEV